MEDGLRTLALVAAQRHAAIREQLRHPHIELVHKDADTAFLLELLGGIFGFLGIGYIYSGLTNAGLLRLFGMWAFLTLSWTFAGILGTVLIGFCFMPLIPLVQIFIAYKSAAELKQGVIAAKAMRSEESPTSLYLGGTPESPIPPLYGWEEQERKNRY